LLITSPSDPQTDATSGILLCFPTHLGEERDGWWRGKSPTVERRMVSSRTEKTAKRAYPPRPGARLGSDDRNIQASRAENPSHFTGHLVGQKDFGRKGGHDRIETSIP